MKTSGRTNRAAVTLFQAAATSYAANVALGTAVKTRMLDSSGFHWAHHALYISTCLLGGAAASTLFWARGKDGSRSRAALALLPAAIPLAAIPAISARSGKHVLIGLAAAPFFAAGLVGAMRGR